MTETTQNIPTPAAQLPTPSEKKPYQTPALIPHGSIEQLTHDAPDFSGQPA